MYYSNIRISDDGDIYRLNEEYYPLGHIYNDMPEPDDPYQNFIDNHDDYLFSLEDD